MKIEDCKPGMRVRYGTGRNVWAVTDVHLNLGKATLARYRDRMFVRIEDLTPADALDEAPLPVDEDRIVNALSAHVEPAPPDGWAELVKVEVRASQCWRAAKRVIASETGVDESAVPHSSVAVLAAAMLSASYSAELVAAQRAVVDCQVRLVQSVEADHV